MVSGVFSVFINIKIGGLRKTVYVNLLSPRNFLLLMIIEQINTDSNKALQIFSLCVTLT